MRLNGDGRKSAKIVAAAILEVHVYCIELTFTVWF